MRTSWIAWTCCSGVAAVLFGVAIVIAQQGPGPSDESASARLRQLGIAVAMYENENKGYLPADVSLLRPYLKRSPGVLDEVQRDFAYIVPPNTRISRLHTPERFPIAMSRPQPEAPILILMGDGRVREYVPAESAARFAPRGTDANAAPAQPAVTRPAPPADSPSGDLAKSLTGAWKTEVGGFEALYQFEHDGTFSLTFSPASGAQPGGYVPPGAGKAGGTWTLDGRHLVMTNTASGTPFTVVGEKEEGDVTRVSGAELVLRTTDRKGNPEGITFSRSVPFKKGQRENEKLVGTWNQQGMTLVLAPSGLAVLGPFKGEWAQHGHTLTLMLQQPPASARGGGRFGAAGPGTRPLNSQATAPAERELQIDLVDDTTLVLTGSLWQLSQTQTMTFLRVK